MLNKTHSQDRTETPMALTLAEREAVAACIRNCNPSYYTFRGFTPQDMADLAHRIEWGETR